MYCKICHNSTIKIFNALVLNKYEIEYFHCSSCGFLQTEEPYWLAEAYAESITQSDTGILERNQLFAREISLLLAACFNIEGKYVDYAGGYGIFTRLMRDIGFDFYWTDPFTKNLVARGFEYTESLKPIEAITTFETFEHFVDPMKEIEKLLSISSTIIFSTQLLPEPVPHPGKWWYYVLNHGQHVSLYSKKTLEFIAQKYSVKYYNFGSFHIFTPKQLKINYVRFIFRFQRYGVRRLLLRFAKSKTFSDFASFNSNN